MEESRIKKVMAILLAILFVVSLTAVAVDAYRGGGFGSGAPAMKGNSGVDAHSMSGAVLGPHPATDPATDTAHGGIRPNLRAKQID
jgi:hypothetical protein